jgi:hypothetical protein
MRMDRAKGSARHRPASIDPRRLVRSGERSIDTSMMAISGRRFFRVSTSIQSGDSMSNKKPRTARTRTVRLIAAVGLIAASLVLPEATAVEAQGMTATVASYHFSPSPVWTSGTISAGQEVSLSVTAESSNGAPVSGAMVNLEFTTSGSAQAVAEVPGSPPTSISLGSYDVTIQTNAKGVIQMTYYASNPLPSPMAGNGDTFIAWNASDSVEAVDSYTYAKPVKPYVSDVTVAIAPQSVLGTDGTFSEVITATSVGPTSAWEATEQGVECNNDIYLGRFAGGNSFKHAFPAPPSGGCPVYFELVALDSAGRAGTPGYSQANSLTTAVFDDSAYGSFTLNTGAWASICGSQYFGGCEEHSSSGLGTQASYAAGQGELDANPGAYSIGIVGSTGPQGGLADVYINDIYRGEINFYTHAVTYRHVLFAYGVAPQAPALPSLVTVRIVVVGKGSKGGGYSINLDAAVENECCGD